MSDLDRTLDEILQRHFEIEDDPSCQRSHFYHDVEVARKDIKRAFRSYGYSNNIMIIDELPSKTVTGQEWYDRFEKELRSVASSYAAGIADPKLQASLRAARRVAGIDND